jgi:putative phosphoribosyl transferase
MTAELPLENRREAGRRLATLVRARDLPNDIIVLGLPRGGVPVAYEVARALDAPLDVFLVRKLGVPGHEELAMGAIATGGIRVLNHDVVDELRISESEIQRVAEKEWIELRRREESYRDDLPPPPIARRHVVLVDDGLATGASMRAAIEAVKAQGPARITVAIPVAAPPVYDQLAELVDDIVCVATPTPFHGVGWWYEDFGPTSDDEVRSLLSDAVDLGQHSTGAG